MTIGIILVFNNSVKTLHRKTLENLLRKVKMLPICFVNNGSDDETLRLLKSIKIDTESDVLLLDIKRNTSTKAAVKAGARCLFNAFDLDYTGYLVVNSQVTYKSVNNFISALKVHKDFVDEYNINRTYNKKSYGRIWFRNIFSIIHYLDALGDRMMIEPHKSVSN